MLNVGKAITEFQEKKCLFVDLCSKVEPLLNDLLRKQNVKFHTISARVKAEPKLRKKLLKSASKYSSLYDVTDLSGLRIITYFEDEIDTIAKIIESEFDIDWENTIDRRKILSPNVFGYLSLHYIVSFDKKKLKRKAFADYKDIRFEIQIRSILQHAWAEIEHDLGYKSEIEVPYEIRRKFSRLAGLLEIADSEFISLRNFSNNYELDVCKNLKISPDAISINKVSLDIFIKESHISVKLDKSIAAIGMTKLESNIEFVSVLLKIVYFNNISTVKELEKLLIDNFEETISFAKLWLNKKDIDTYSTGIGIWYFGLVRVLGYSSDKELMDYIRFVGIGTSSERDALIENLSTIFRELEA